MTANKNVLMVAPYFFPCSLAGAHRASRTAAALVKHGWYPTVLTGDWTPQNSGGFCDNKLAGSLPPAIRIERVPMAGYRTSLAHRAKGKVQHAALPYIAPVDLFWGMLRRVQYLTEYERFDAVWSTYTPGLAHVVAAYVAARRKLPWVADFRDLPDQSCDNLRTRMLVLTERAVCRQASALTTTSDVLAQKLRARHLAPVHVILNGYDSEDTFPTNRDSQDSQQSQTNAPPTHDLNRQNTPKASKLRIRYFGIFYPGYRDPRPLFAAVDQLAQRGEVDPRDLEIEFYGVDAPQLQQLAEPYVSREQVRHVGRVPHAEARRLQRSADILLNLQSAEAGGAIPSKVFEYLGARRPILNVPGDGGPIDEVMRRTGLGHSAGTPEQIATVLGDWYREWKRSGCIATEFHADACEEYSRERQVARLAKILDDLHDSHAPRPYL